MKKNLMILLSILFVLSFSMMQVFAAKKFSKDPVVEKQEKEAKEEEVKMSDKKILVVYYSATGTTKEVAEKIAKAANADIYEITALKPYSNADLNWHDSKSRTTIEQNDSSIRPEIASKDVDVSKYDLIFIGYPIWWGDEPRILDTFVEKYDFEGKILVPFCTSGGSGIGRSGKNLEKNAKSGKWLDGRRLSTSTSEKELTSKLF